RRTRARRRPGARQRFARHAHRHCRGPIERGGLMLYYLFYRFYGVNVAHYITFRTAVASLTAFAISLLLGPWLIRRLRAFQVGQVVRSDGPATHLHKAGTPTMGGLLILAGVLGPT